MQRTTSFGYGTRVNFAGRQGSPPPNTYLLPSDFDAMSKKGQVFSFGISREAYSKVYAKDQPQGDSSIPGPGTYNVVQAPGRDARKFSFRAREVESSTWTCQG
jgi:hypothetical protein